MSVTLKKEKEDSITKALTAMITRSKSISSYLNRVVYKKYQKAQLERWKSENASEGVQWKPLNPTYKNRKKRTFSGYPGGGNVMMTATGRLVAGATGRDSAYAYKLISDTQFIVGVNDSALPYAKYPGTSRPYMEFSDETIKGWKDGIARYIGKGVSR